MNHTTKKINSIKNSSSKQKIGFFSVILLVVGSCIGAGIFFKNKSVLADSQGSIVLAIICWLIAAFGVLAMGVSLVEICSANNKYNGQGIIGWVRVFNKWFIYKACRNFLAYIYWPLMFVSMGLYFTQSIQTAFGWKAQWYWVVLISFAVIVWFIFTSGISATIANISNWIIMCFKFLPLIFAFVIGWIILGINHGDISNPIWPDPNYNQNNTTPLLDQINPGFGVMASIPAIFFAFNGFYSPVSLQSEMKEPKKNSLAMALGIAIVAFLYVAIAVSLMLCSKTGSVDNIYWLQEHAPWVIKVVYALITIGILSVINGKAIASCKLYEDLILDKQILFWHRFYSRANLKKPVRGAMYAFVLTSGIYFLSIIVGLFFDNTSNYGSLFTAWGVAGLYSFVDIISNWGVFFAFAIITIAILGGLINRKTNKIKVAKSKLFVPAAWISIVMVAIIFLYIVVSSFTNIGLVSYYYSNHMYKDQESANTTLLSVIMSVSMLTLYIIVPIVPAYITRNHGNKKIVLS